MANQLKLHQICLCRMHYGPQKKRTKDRCKRKRQRFVYNPEEEIWHEPYMQSLRREFSDESVLCDSKIELPWRDIALPAAGLKIRPDVITAPTIDQEAKEVDVRDEETGEMEKRESTGIMTLPWQDLLITETLRFIQDDPETCDSTVEIPWSDLILEKPIEIRTPKEERLCEFDDVEIPWDEILLPHNIVIESDKKKRHSSSGQSSRAQPGARFQRRVSSCEN